MATAFDSTGASTATGTNTGVSFAFNNVAGTFLWATIESGISAGNVTSGFLTGVTYGGVALTLVGTEQAASTSARIWVYKLLAPATGSNTFAVTYASTTVTTIVHLVSASGTTPDVRNFVTTISNGAVTSPTLATTVTTVGNLVIGSGAHGDAVTGISGAWGTQRQSNNVDGFTAGDNMITGTVASASGTINVAFTDTSSDTWMMAAGEIYEAAAGGPSGEASFIPDAIMGPGSQGPMAFQWQQTTGTDEVQAVAGTTDAVHGTLAIRGRVDGARGAAGATRGRLAVRIRDAGSKGGAAVVAGRLAVRVKAATTKGGSARAAGRLAVQGADRGTFGAIARVLGRLAVRITARGSAIAGATGKMGGRLAVRGRVDGTRTAAGATRGRLAVRGRVAATRAAVAAARGRLAVRGRVVETASTPQASTGAPRLTLAARGRAAGTRSALGATHVRLAVRGTARTSLRAVTANTVRGRLGVRVAARGARGALAAFRLRLGIRGRASGALVPPFVIGRAVSTIVGPSATSSITLTAGATSTLVAPGATSHLIMEP